MSTVQRKLLDTYERSRPYSGREYAGYVARKTGDIMDTESVDSGMTASHSPIEGREYADAAARSRQSAYVWKTLGLYGMSDSGTDATQPLA